MKRITLYNRKSKGAIKVWHCEVSGHTVTSRWGQLDGVMQTSTDVLKPIGTVERGNYKSAEIAAVEEFERRIEGKKRAGYVVDLSGVRAEVTLGDSGLDFDHLPKSFAPAKPITSVDEDEAGEWDAKGLLCTQRKHDGMRHYLVQGKDGLRVYSRGMDDMTETFQPLIHRWKLPVGTILDAEFVVIDEDNHDDFKTVSSICRSLPAAAHKVIAPLLRNPDVHVGFMVFDVLFAEGKPVYKEDYKTRLFKARDILSVHRPIVYGKHIWITHPLSSFHEGIKLVKKNGWEGLVLWRLDQPTVVQMNRTPKRTNCYKFKILLEDDFVATGYDLGTGQHAKRVGALNIAQYKGGKLVPLGNVGSGFDTQTREEALTWEYPCVVQLKFAERSETGLRFPVFMRKRDDKRPKECKA